MAQHAERRASASGSSCARSKCATRKSCCARSSASRRKRPQAFAALLDSRIALLSQDRRRFRRDGALADAVRILGVRRGRWADVIRREPARHVPPRCGVRGQDPSRARSRPIFRSNSRTKFELAINLKTAKALGLAIPQSCCSESIASSSNAAQRTQVTEIRRARPCPSIRPQLFLRMISPQRS